ncbi:hypothetical protein GOBAR_AA18917 [Gossypium barbadense]|uniref:Uncharacterized protein n=1 Tax=Gossypium barbadense TaxID=3634 RepID=A0A2P5XEJ1_GOSBA|nr:hypothetical protein GOBAR_AA18917 [Gossypium barbadense]
MGSHEWKGTGMKPILPPMGRVVPRRPKKNKRMAKDEPQNSLQQTTTHCADTPATSETPQNPSAIADKSGISTRRGIYELNNSSDAQSSNKKRKATGDEIGTQESVAPKK